MITKYWCQFQIVIYSEVPYIAGDYSAIIDPAQDLIPAHRSRADVFASIR